MQSQQIQDQRTEKPDFESAKIRLLLVMVTNG